MVMLWPVEVEVIGQLDYFFRSCLLASFAVQTISIAAYLKLTPQTQYKNFMQNEPVVDSSTTQNLVIFLLFATLLTVFVAIIFADTVGFSFLEAVIRKAGDEFFFIEAREASFKWLDPRIGRQEGTEFFYLLLGLRMWVLPIAVIVSIFLLFSKTNFIVKCVALVEIALSLLLLSSNFARAPVAAVMLRLTVFVSVFNFSSRAKIIAIIAFGIAVLVPISITSTIYGENMVAGAERIALRLIRQPAYDVYQYFLFCGNNIAFAEGELLLRPIKSVLGLPNVYIENIIYHHIYPPPKIFSGHNNAAFISNAFCDFSAAGVIFFSALSSILSVSLFQWFARGPKTPMNLILFSCICYQVWIFNFGSINSVLLANGLIFTVLFKLLWDSSCIPRKARE